MAAASSRARASTPTLAPAPMVSCGDPEDPGCVTLHPLAEGRQRFPSFGGYQAHCGPIEAYRPPCEPGEPCCDPFTERRLAQGAGCGEPHTVRRCDPDGGRHRWTVTTVRRTCNEASECTSEALRESVSDRWCPTQCENVGETEVRCLDEDEVPCTSGACCDIATGEPLPLGALCRDIPISGTETRCAPNGAAIEERTLGRGCDGVATSCADDVDATTAWETVEACPTGTTCTDGADGFACVEGARPCEEGLCCSGDGTIEPAGTPC